MAAAAVVCQRHFSPLARSSCAPTNASTPCPDPPRPISATPDRSRPSAVPRNGAATEQNGKKRPDGGRKRCCGRQPKGTSGRGDPWPGLCSRGQPRGASKAPLPARLACYSARASDPRGGGRGSRWGSCRRPGAAAAAARGARQGAQEGAVALGQGQERAGMGRARVGVPPGERRLRATHVERVGAATVGGCGGWGGRFGLGLRPRSSVQEYKISHGNFKRSSSVWTCQGPWGAL